ncbi:lanthionine synthetase C family protein [Streptococcus agalactiae]|uniref:lanthionine synthetase C family protein n=1 Tax=Streptococcus agalactiae TaxID=1311 RepID=UPI0020C4E955|nr:lanthionine synthetase C family protein [Streptococcus agalactiae]
MELYMIPQIEQIVDYIADSFTNYEQIVAESANKKLVNIDPKYQNTFFEKSLSHGIPSLILMYSSLYKVTKQEKYMRLSNLYIEKLVGVISKDGIESPSLYAGTAGIALAIREASISGKYYTKLLNSLHCLLKEQIQDKLIISLSNIDKGIAEPFDYDMVNGFSGIANYLILEREYFFEELNQIGTYLLKYIEIILDKVTNCSAGIKNELDLGIAHGIVGPMLILAKLKSEGVFKEDLEILNKAIKLVFLCRRDDKLWPGKIYSDNILNLDFSTLPTRMAWCYGTPGTAVALFQICQLMDLNYTDDIIESLISQINSTEKNIYSDSMCHGLSGVAFIYDLIGKNSSNVELTNFADYLRQKIIMSFSNNKLFGYTDREKLGDVEVELESVGILQGASGIVLFLLTSYSDEELIWERMFR